MGVPEFLKFVSRSAPGALCRVPKGSQSAPLMYDYVLVDATNAAQTVGLASIMDFLRQPNLIVRKAVIFALDSQRDRGGTERHYRQALIKVSDLDVEVQQLCASLSAHYKSMVRNAASIAAETGAQGSFKAPFVVMSGREVAGEADYKILDIQRAIMCAAVASDETQLPSFLFVSEDSDILCGALCGPAPQNASIATTLRDTTFELCILRLIHVVAYVSVCVEALVAEEDVSGDAAIQHSVTAPLPPSGRSHDTIDEKTATTTPSSDVFLEEDNVVRRRRPDGPLVATGVRVELTDSSDDDMEGVGASKSVNAGAASAMAQASSSMAAQRGGVATTPQQHQPTAYELAAGVMTQSSCVDLVFLFLLVMGNGSNVPPLVRGVTKVDMASCWRAYCARKYVGAVGQDREIGRSLVEWGKSSPAGRDGDATLVLHCSFLHTILDHVHYADAQSRPPVEEERNRAMAYLSCAVYAIMRYIVACNIECGAVLRETFLDSRPLSETEVLVPSLAAVLWVLSQEPRRTFRYPLHGMAKKELLAASTGGEDQTVSKDGIFAMGRAPSSRGMMHLDVGEALVCPNSSTSWAVRGKGSQSISLHALMGTTGSSVMHASKLGVPKQSVAANVKRYASAHSPKAATGVTSSVSNTFYAMGVVWRRSLALAVPHLKAAAASTGAITATNDLLDPGAEGSNNGDSFPPKQSSSAGRQSTTGYVYSFELRRMAPVLGVTAGGLASEGGDTITTGASRPPSRVQAGNGAQAALMSALGISLDYATPPPPPTNLASLPRGVIEEETRQARKRAKSERSVPLSHSTVDDAREERTGFRRPGKKERLRMRQQKGSGAQ